MRQSMRLAALLFLPLVLSGCLQLEVTVRLEEDGRGTIIEKLTYSKRLLDSDPEAAGGGLKSFLSKEAAEKRAGSMGTGMKLVSHTLEASEDGGLRSVAQYEIPDLNDARLVYPYFTLPDAEKKQLKLKVYPSYTSAGKDRFNQDQPGWMGIGMGTEHYNYQPKPMPVLSPAKEQELRKLIPVFRDLMQGFKLKMTFEVYGPIRCGGWMNWGAGDSRGSPLLSSKFFELLEFSDQNLDDDGQPVLENDEIMLALMRGDLYSPKLTAMAHEFWRKHNTPIYRPNGRWGSVYVLPSKFHFTKFFEGKPLEMLIDHQTEGQDRWIKK